jgi:hypothetical protein
VNPGPVERFVGVYVADPGQKILVKEERFDQAPLGLNPPDEFPGRNLQRLGAKPAQRRDPPLRPRSFEPNSPELPGVVETKLFPPFTKGKNGVGVLAGLGRRRDKVQPTGHPQVHDQGRPAAQVKNDILPAPGET